MHAHILDTPFENIIIGFMRGAVRHLFVFPPIDELLPFRNKIGLYIGHQNLKRLAAWVQHPKNGVQLTEALIQPESKHLWQFYLADQDRSINEYDTNVGTNPNPKKEFQLLDYVGIDFIANYSNTPEFTACAKKINEMAADPVTFDDQYWLEYVENENCIKNDEETTIDQVFTEHAKQVIASICQSLVMHKLPNCFAKNRALARTNDTNFRDPEAKDVFALDFSHDDYLRKNNGLIRINPKESAGDLQCSLKAGGVMGYVYFLVYFCVYFCVY